MFLLAVHSHNMDIRLPFIGHSYFFLEKVAVVLLFLTAVVENGLDIPEFRLLLCCEWDE